MKAFFKFKFLVLITFSTLSYGQQEPKPKLIVGIVIDQMRAEYLYRFQNNYTEYGFKRLIQQGFNVKNTHYNYVPTVTGPGHASIYTGTTPANHNIIYNNWYSRKLQRVIYCAEDTTATLVDNKHGPNKLLGARSPRNLGTTTITDELKLFSNMRSKVVGISLKDRGAIFPVGHLADGAYWYNLENGNFVTSTYYMDELPKWLQGFNSAKKTDSLLNLVWKPLLPIKKYTNSINDNTDFEKIFKGKKQSTFPYDLKKLRKQNKEYAFLAETPFGNTILTELAIATLKGENLGKGKEIDFLTISYSSTDKIGHSFGIRSKEIEDTYVRMDHEIATLLAALDKHLGKGNYTLFLTADHAGSDNPSFLESINLPGKFYSSQKIKSRLNKQLSQKFGDDNYIVHIDKAQIYFADTKIKKEKVIKQAAKFLRSIEGVKEVFAPKYTELNLNNSVIGTFIKNAYSSKESGDLFFHMYSGWMDHRNFGTTHGTAYTSDTHVPLLWYGAKIPKGETVKPYNVTQIAPTISFLLDIPLANASDKIPILEIFEK